MAPADLLAAVKNYLRTKPVIGGHNTERRRRNVLSGNFTALTTDERDWQPAR
jgi:hypothetical protein